MTRLELILPKTPVRRRILALLMLAFALVVLWGAVLTPVAWIARSQGEWRADARHELARARGKAALEPALRQRSADLMREPIWSRFYDVPLGQDVTALIQRDVLSVAVKAGVTIQAITPSAAVEEGGLAGYGVRFGASMSADQLSRFVDALRSSTHYLRVERLTVTSPQLQRVDQNAPLEVTMEVFGFTRSADRRAGMPMPPPPEPPEVSS